MSAPLTPRWPFLEQLFDPLNHTAPRKIEVKIQAGLPYFCVRLALEGKSSFLVTTEEKAESYAEDAQSWTRLFDSLKEWSVGSVSDSSIKEKNVLLDEAIQSKGLIWSGTMESLSEKVFSKPEFLGIRLELKVGKTFSYSKLLNHLSEYGYSRLNCVEQVGEFSARGEIFDFWSPNYGQPARLIFAHDVIESIHFFDPFTQRTIQFAMEIVLVPRSPKGKPSGFLLDYFPENSVIVTDLFDEPENQKGISGIKFPVIRVSSNGADSGMIPSTPTHLGSHHRAGSGHSELDWSFFKQELKKNTSQALNNFIFCRNMGELQRMEEILDEVRCGENERPKLIVAALNQGFVNSQLQIAVWSYGEAVGAPTPMRRMPKFKTGRVFDSMVELRLGDYVVHESFGIGKYKGLERISVQAGKKPRGSFRKEKESEFLVLEYKGGDRLFIPIQDLQLVQKYVGAEGKKPRLYSLDGIAWDRIKQKVRKEVADLAVDLLKTAALRESSVRSALEPETHSVNEHLYSEFVQAFPYEETPDQLTAIKEIEEDLKSVHFMDRLVCGDVGYGKTEIAMRAAFRAVIRGDQVAMLVPTTILAEQHFKNFTERFSPFPVSIEMLSRFQNVSDQKRIVADLKDGLIDILIGTHKIVQKEVQFKNLGLLIIDEEHRFGVQQKEALKKLKTTVDLLTLTATPIPRTLSLSLGGVRKISLIETPPEGRLPIETFIGPFDEEKLSEAVRRELGRGGQIFYVHNRISTIETRKHSLEKLFPGLRIGMAHGQMSGEVLEKAMWNFLNKEWDLLLSTSIIESGLDIPNVNTLVVEDSEEFGLAQLYQLRGRVGRKREKAYCYLFFSDWSKLSEDARKRLSAIREFSALGSGMKLALRDMEIRGTGNLLGAQQHGWVTAVGLDLYCQLLNEEVEKIKQQKGLAARPEKERKPELPPVEIELNISAFIPQEYVESMGERISFYKKMMGCGSVEEIEKLESELVDRFGAVPLQVKNLFQLLQLKAEARQWNVASIVEGEKGMILGWPVVDGQIPVLMVQLAKDFPDGVEILPSPPNAGARPLLKILFKETCGDDPFAAARKCLNISSKYVILKELR